MTTASPPLVRFACPRCRGELDAAIQGPPDGRHDHAATARCRDELDGAIQSYRCQACGAEYPVIAGIPDFRLAPDPWLGIAADREKALRLEAVTRDLDFEDSVRAYWEMTPTTPRRQAEHFIEHVLGASTRSREWLAQLEHEEATAPDGPCLDLGCGTGDLLAAVNGAAIGIDIALRWLVIAKKRPVLAGTTGRLVCCCAQHLPFPDNSFTRVLSLGLLEHVADPLPVAVEAQRVLRHGGLFCLRTTGRYTPLREPHIGVRGVGFIPRRWADRYVQRMSGERYLHHRPLSPRGLRRALRGAPLEQVRVRPARLLAAEATRLTGLASRLAPLYQRARRTPVLRDACAWIAPLLEGRGEKARP